MASSREDDAFFSKVQPDTLKSASEEPILQSLTPPLCPLVQGEQEIRERTTTGRKYIHFAFDCCPADQLGPDLQANLLRKERPAEGKQIRLYLKKMNQTEDLKEQKLQDLKEKPVSDCPLRTKNPPPRQMVLQIGRLLFEAKALYYAEICHYRSHRNTCSKPRGRIP